jgi:hypothetical protein
MGRWQEVEAALTELEGLARRGKRFSHHLARRLLLALGRALEEETPEACAPWVARARATAGLAGEGWSSALRDELTLACGEFIQCVDPRYLGLSGYDMEYTRAARARLADRLRAARALGHELPPREAELLALADQVLATAARRSDERRGSASSTGSSHASGGQASLN